MWVHCVAVAVVVSSVSSAGVGVSWTPAATVLAAEASPPTEGRVLQHTSQQACLPMMARSAQLPLRGNDVAGEDAPWEPCNAIGGAGGGGLSAASAATGGWVADGDWPADEHSLSSASTMFPSTSATPIGMPATAGSGTLAAVCLLLA